jgi:ketosteroid isomerase-like protein
MTESNVERARSGYAAIARGDVDVLRGLFAPDVRWHGGDPTAIGACRNSDEAIRFIRAARARGPLPELVEVIDAGDRVVVVVRPAGEQELRANVTTFRDGKVVEMVAYESPEAARAAAGLG